MFPATYRLAPINDTVTLVTREGKNLFGPGIVTKEMEFSHPIEKMHAGLKAYVNGAFIQDAFPFLAPPEREFIMSGTTPSEWDAMFGEDEE